MPYVIDPTAPKPVPPTIQHSMDGVLTATADLTYAGVQLYADYSGSQLVRENLYPDPGQRYALLPWGATPTVGSGTLTLESAGALLGSRAVLVSTSADGAVYRNSSAWTPGGLGLAAGDQLTVSCWVKIAASATPQSTILYLGGTGITPVAIPAGQVTLRDSWVQVQATTAVVDATAAMYLRIYGGSKAGDAIRFSDFGLAEGAEPVSFSGDTAADATYAYSWAGTPGVSVSLATPLRPTRQVRFFREDGSPVRSGDPSIAVGGSALAYDAEVPLGVRSTWYAVPVDKDGNEGPRSGTVTLTLPAPDAARAVWLKSVVRPDLSLAVTVAGDVPELTYAAKQDLATIQGSPFPAVSSDGWAAATGSITFWAPSPDIKRAILSCLMSGVVLMQTRPDYDLADMFVVAGDLTRSRPGAVQQTESTLTVPFVEVARPATAGAPRIVPGHTWADVERNNANWGAVEDSYSSWLAVEALPVA